MKQGRTFTDRKKCGCRDEEEAAPLQRERPQAKHDTAIMAQGGAECKGF